MVTDCTGATGLAGYTALPIQLSVDYKPEVCRGRCFMLVILIFHFSVQPYGGTLIDDTGLNEIILDCCTF